ncbi:MAG: DUF2281 domain-containing protein [Actinobacteria bacterium]|nr:DUF2281 domain-containing protein [Actinomycetota bacterium]
MSKDHSITGNSDSNPQPRAGRGSAHGRIWIADDFDAPMPDIEGDVIASIVRD